MAVQLEKRKVTVIADGGAGNDEIGIATKAGSSLYGGPGNDKLTGGAGADNIDGGSGNDNLTGSAGDDTLIGRSGHDGLWGDEGNDFLNGKDNGNDAFNGGDGNDTASIDHGLQGDYDGVIPLADWLRFHYLESGG